MYSYKNIYILQEGLVEIREDYADEGFSETLPTAGFYLPLVSITAHEYTFYYKRED